MKEIIFWFNRHEARNYWLEYAIDCLKKHTMDIKYNRIENWVEFLNLKISFKVNIRGDLDLTSNWDKNQYWTEDLFNNDFEEFFFDIIFENKLFDKMEG